MGLVRPPIVFYAFDLLRLNGQDLKDLPIEEREAKLEELLKKPPGVIRYSVSSQKTSKSWRDADALGINVTVDATANAGWAAPVSHFGRQFRLSLAVALDRGTQR
jgi:hypothetical protein